MLVLTILSLVGALCGLLVASLYVVLAAVAVTATLPFAVSGPLALVVAPVAALPTGLVLAVLLLLLVKQVIGWYAVASLSNTAAVDAAVLAACTPGPPATAILIPPNFVERFARGYAIGLNAGLNFGVWVIVLPGFGAIIGAPIGLINLMAAIPALTPVRAYQMVLGWSSWLMPMSWLATGLGLILFFVNLFSGGVIAIAVDFSTGAIETFGGAAIAVTGFGGGFCLGNFTFITAASLAPPSGFAAPGISTHETGHTLNVAAFGSLWHFAGNAIEENIAPFPRPVSCVRAGPSAYGELLADSHFPGVTAFGASVFLTMW